MTTQAAAAGEVRPPLRWMRWGAWAAHLFRDGAQVCSTTHSRYEHGNTGTLREAELATCGLPFGRVCARCAKTWRREVAS